MNSLRHTPLHALHRELGARLVPFAGFEMPLQYRGGILAEHRHCRASAALFDVSHMGQIMLSGAGAAAALEALVPSDVRELAPGRCRYTVFTNEQGGILDDLIVACEEAGRLRLVVNASCRESDLHHLRASLPREVEVRLLEDEALIALQGPKAAAVLARLVPEAVRLRFMETGRFQLPDVACRISRTGYTGEDGFEIAVPAARAEALFRRLLAEPEVAPAGLGARDTLRLEAGLCLYGQDIDASTTPVEAGLGFVVGKRRRQEGGFPGAAIILRQLREGAARRLVGLKVEGRQPVRAGASLADAEGRTVGRVTSGGFGPTCGAPIALGYVEARLAAPGSALTAVVRDRRMPLRVVSLPFVPHRYRRQGGGA